MDPVVTIILSIGSICSAVMAFIALISLVFKKPKQWIKKWIKDLTRDELNEQLDAIRDQIDSLLEREKTKLGHSIMTIYDRSMSRGYITPADKKDLIELHQAYKLAKGNHHVDEYFEIMMDMDVKQ